MIIPSYHQAGGRRSTNDDDNVPEVEEWQERPRRRSSSQDAKSAATDCENRNSSSSNNNNMDDELQDLLVVDDTVSTDLYGESGSNDNRTGYTTTKHVLSLVVLVVCAAMAVVFFVTVDGKSYGLLKMGVISGKSPSVVTPSSSSSSNGDKDSVTSIITSSNNDDGDDEEMRKRMRNHRTEIANRARHKLNSDVKHVPQKECIVTVLITRHCNDYGLFARDDDEEGDKHCSYMGYERSRYFAGLFEDEKNEDKQHKKKANEVATSSRPEDEDGGGHRQNSNKKRWPKPSAMYALLPDFETQTGGINYRQIEMLLPLANRTKVGINVVSTPEQVADSIFRRIQQGVATDSKTTILPEDDDVNHERHKDICGEVIVVSWKHHFIPDVAAALGCGHDQGCLDEYPSSFDVLWMLRFVHEPPVPQNVVAQLLDEDSVLIKDDLGILKDQRFKQQQLGYPACDFTKILNTTTSSETINIGWEVYGSEAKQHFDPLEYEHLSS